MTKGIEVECRKCQNKFWLDVKLNFGARKHKNDQNLLNCFLDCIRFYFKCPYCKENKIVEVEFFVNGQSEAKIIVENPDYIG